MRILLLAPYPPYPPRGGGAQRMYQFVQGLGQRHDLTCLSFAPNEASAAALAPLRQHCRLEIVLGPPPRSLRQRAWTTLASPLPDIALRNASPAFLVRLAELLRETRFDAVQASSIEMARYIELARGSAPRPALVLDQFNAEYVLQRRAAFNSLRASLASGSPKQRFKQVAAGTYSLVQWLKLARYEQGLLRRLDLMLAVSEEDRAALHRLHPQGRILVVPNGVDCGFFAPQPQVRRREPATLVFTGTMDYRPNIDAVRWFVAEVLPIVRAERPEVRLQIVGRAPTPAVQMLANDPAIAVTGEVEDVRPAIAAAAAYVVPMRIGGGVRLKLLEALAMEAPVVSTRMGAEGVRGLEHGLHCLLADDASSFAASVLKLLNNPALGARLGSVGRTQIATRYDWSAIIPLFNQVYPSIQLLS